MRFRKIRNGFRSAFFLLLFQAPLLAAGGSWFGGGSNDGNDRSSERPAIGCPQVNNLTGATNVSAASACLNGMLLSTGEAPTTVYVYWGTTNGGANKTNWGASICFGERVEGEMLTTSISVNPNTTYYYRFYATNTAGDESWASTSAVFLTPIAPVLGVAAGAAPVSYRTATLNGELTAGVSADITIYWGQHTNAWSATNHLGTRFQGKFEKGVSGLSPGSVYYYRSQGVNADGEGWSDIVGFTARVESVWFAGGGSDGYMECQGSSRLTTGDGLLIHIE